MTTAVFATAYGGPEALATEDVEVPEPGPGQVTIDVRAIGVNAIDVKAYSGMFGTDESKLPMKLGSEVSGVVTRRRRGRRGTCGGPLTVGDEVIGYPISAAYAQRHEREAASVFPKPSSLSFEQAAGLSLVGVDRLPPRSRPRTWARATRSWCTAPPEASGGWPAQLAVGRGATVDRHRCLVPSRRAAGLGVVPVAYGDGLADRVRAAAPGGVDVALDTVGTDEAVDVSLELVADRARIATVAAFGRAGEAGILLLGNGPGADPGTELRQRARLTLTDLAEKGELDVVVAASFPLSDAASAHRLGQRGSRRRQGRAGSVGSSGATSHAHVRHDA